MTPRGYSRGKGRLLKQKKKARKRKKLKGSPVKVVYRDESGKFTKQSGRKKQGIQIIGEEGYIEPKRRSRAEASKALGKIKQKERSFTASTHVGTMADRILETVSSSGKSLAHEFSKGPQSGIVIVEAGDLSFTYTFGTQDLQEMLAGALTQYFQRAHAVRERVSAKARAGKGNHRKYDRYTGAVNVVVKLY